MEEILFDPQTSGGLLIAVDSADASALLERIRAKNPAAAIVGQIVEATDKRMTII